MINSKNYVKILRREANRIIDVLNNTNKNKRSEVLKSEIDKLKEDFGTDLTATVKDVGRYKLID